MKMEAKQFTTLGLKKWSITFRCFFQTDTRKFSSILLLNFSEFILTWSEDNRVFEIIVGDYIVKYAFV